jgi:membrane fusion protein (multidrug efflux system)
VLLVPQVAIQEFQGTHQVYIAGTDGKAHVETVQLGSQVGTNWLVESGLSPGMQVIVDNLLKLRDGSPVSPHQASADTSTAAATAQNNASAGR